MTTGQFGNSQSIEEEQKSSIGQEQVTYPTHKQLQQAFFQQQQLEEAKMQAQARNHYNEQQR